jgi:anti-sigma B factor antagonist
MSDGRPVVVQEIPQTLTQENARLFLQEVDPYLKADRPRIVFDFSSVRELDGAGVEMLLYCTEEVMKRNGDLKLAAVPPGPAVILELTKVDRLFEIFETSSEAVESFHRFPVQMDQAPPAWLSVGSAQAHESTA